MQAIQLYIGNALKWQLFFTAANPSGIATTDSNPTFVVRKNNVISGSDTVTITDRFTAEGTGALNQFYLLSWTPSDQTEGTQYTIEQRATIGGNVHLGETLHVTIRAASPPLLNGIFQG